MVKIRTLIIALFFFAPVSLFAMDGDMIRAENIEQIKPDFLTFFDTQARSEYNTLEMVPSGENIVAKAALAVVNKTTQAVYGKEIDLRTSKAFLTRVFQDETGFKQNVDNLASGKKPESVVYINRILKSLKPTDFETKDIAKLAGQMTKDRHPDWLADKGREDKDIIATMPQDKFGSFAAAQLFLVYLIRQGIFLE